MLLQNPSFLDILLRIIQGAPMTVKEIVQTHSDWVQFVGGNEEATIERADHKGTQASHAMIYVGSPKDVEPALKSSGVFCVCLPGFAVQAGF